MHKETDLCYFLASSRNILTNLPAAKEQHFPVWSGGSVANSLSTELWKDLFVRRIRS
jgi:hypothetical protein